MHKGYTISFFIKTVSALSETQIKNDFYNTLAPRGGYWSVKAERFDDWVGCTEEIIEGKTKRAKSLGKTAKTRLLTALRRRRTTGKVF